MFVWSRGDGGGGRKWMVMMRVSSFAGVAGFTCGREMRWRFDLLFDPGKC